MRIASLWLGLGLFAGAASCATGSIWWNQENGNSRRSSYLGVATADAVAPKWTVLIQHWSPIAKVYPNAPVLAPDGAIICSASVSYPFEDEAGYVECIEPDSNQRYRWRAEDPQSTVKYQDVGTPSVAADGSVVVMCRNNNVNHLFHLDRDGHVLWSWRYQFGPVDTAIVGTHVFFEERNSLPVPRTNLVALDLQTRTEHRLFFDQVDALNWWCVAPTHDLAGTDYLVVFQDRRAPKRVTWARFAPSIGFTPGGDIGPPLAPQETFALPPVVSREGQIVVARVTFSDDGWGIRVLDSTLKPLLEREYAPGSGPFWHPFRIALGWDRADFTLYLIEESSAVYTDRIVALTGGTYSTTSFPLDGPVSAPTVTKSRVYVSDTSGLHTFSLGLQGHVVAVAPGEYKYNPRPLQPAVHWDGTIYDLVSYPDFGGSVRLRAFAAPLSE